MTSVWRKSSRSGSSGSQSDCVEVAKLSRNIAIRDSKDPSAGHISVSRESFSALLTKVKCGELTT